ncbi:MAG: hypothetical protein WC444_06880 [Candidatus Paceibacterota bacterium]
MTDDFVEEVKPAFGMRKRPDCQAPNCAQPKETALCLVAGKWVCGDCAMKKHEEINAKIWS